MLAIYSLLIGFLILLSLASFFLELEEGFGLNSTCPWLLRHIFRWFGYAGGMLVLLIVLLMIVAEWLDDQPRESWQHQSG